MARATARIGLTNYATTIISGGHTVIADEGPDLGGQDAGLAPYDLLAASLGACTAITLRMYAQRKGWDLSAAEANVHVDNTGERTRIERVVTLTGALDDAQKARLLDICERTPVTLTLKAGADITTSLVA